jgi:hypothetical protein
VRRRRADGAANRPLLPAIPRDARDGIGARGGDGDRARSSSAVHASAEPSPMTLRTTFSLALVFSPLALAIACGTHDAAPVDAPASRIVPRGMLLKSDGPLARPHLSTAGNLKYYSGPVLSNVKVWTVFWNASIPNQDKLNLFFGEVTKSAYFDWLTEYNTPTQTIGHGSFAGTVVDPSPPAKTKISNEEVAGELKRLIGAGTLPANDENTLYMVYFPPGVDITLDTSTSCVEFCAFHNTSTLNGKNLYYGVMPDLGGGCATGCGASSQFNNLTSVSSHELVEAVTDPAVGLAQTVGAPMAWYDAIGGEIGDLCNAEQETMGDWTVQRQWSNKEGACITHAGAQNDDGGAPDAGDDNGTCVHKTCTTGARLTTGCNPCVTQICAQDHYCCATSWDTTCVSEVGSVCGHACP